MYWLTNILPQILHFHLFLIVDCSRPERFSCPSVIEGINSLIIVGHIVKVFPQMCKVLSYARMNAVMMTQREMLFEDDGQSPPPLGYTNDITK